MEEGFADLTIIKEMFENIFHKTIAFNYQSIDITAECVVGVNEKILNHAYYSDFANGASDIRITFTGFRFLCEYTLDCLYNFLNNIYIS